MSRSYTYSALALRVKTSGESNREAWFLTAEEGILRTTVFGGPKSRLRAYAAPFHQGTIWVYHDPVRDSRKLNDFDVLSWRPGLRERYERTLAANALAETILASHGGGGSWKTAMDLAADTLDCIETADEKICSRILLHFFWVWAGFLGIRPDIRRCSSCACEVSPDGIVWYDEREGGICCRSCGGEGIRLGAGARRWLFTVQDMKPSDALRYDLDNVSQEQARAVVLAILSEALGKRLPLWNEI